jgi:chorismate-pyruvate lyase
MADSVLPGAAVAPAGHADQIVALLWHALGLPAPAIDVLTAEQIPAPFQALLTHTAGMTSTLEQHWREPIDVDLLSDDIAVEQRALFRFVVLRTRRSRLAVELAMIRIPMEVFPESLRARFIEAQRPFGSLLEEAGIRFRGCPQAFFALRADAPLAGQAGLSAGTRMYGRINHLIRDDGVLLCETAELLPRA